MLLCFVAIAAAQENVKALLPVDRKDEWWQKRFAEKNEQLKKGDAELLLVGDSITNGWDNDSAKEAREKYLDGWKWVNLGFSGDQTQHVLWRLENAPMDAVKPKAIMLMIGTNNIGNKQSPEDTVLGIAAIVKKLKDLYPNAKILVLNVFPRDEKPDGRLRVEVDKINSLLPKTLGKQKNVTLFSINDKFLDKDGTLPKSVMPDSLHPQKDGYLIWGETVQPKLKSMIEQKSTSSSYVKSTTRRAARRAR
jgi:lysophospholipase L1-like esterase